MISAIVPTRGGDARLERNLGSVSVSLAAAGQPSEVVVVDDGGELRRPPQGARALPCLPAGGYARAVNLGARAAGGDLLLILNDDVRLEESTVRLLLAALPSKGVFAVVPSILSPLARSGDEGGKAARWRLGLLEIEEAPSPETHETFYAVGCCFLCRRESFLELGGYDEAFAPFFWEDVDLSYRAWRRGLASLHVPAAVCHHEGSATIGGRPMAEREQAWYRNWALFHLRNLRDPRLRSECLGAWTAHALFDDRETVRAGIAEAFAWFERHGPRTEAGLSDEEILARVRPG